MTCGICGFENLPGTDRCLRCQAILTVPGNLGRPDRVPPRAGRTSRFRPLVFRLNALVDRLPARLADRLSIVLGGGRYPDRAVGAIIWSLVPGLGHVVTGRFRTGLTALLTWGLLFLAAINLMGYPFAPWLWIGTAAFHAMTAFDAGEIRRHTPETSGRIWMMIWLLAVSSLGYGVTYVTIGRLAPWHTSPTVLEGMQIQPGEIMFNQKKNTPWPQPGMAAWFDLGRLDLPGWRPGRRNRPMIGLVIASSGDRVAVSPQGLTVNGIPADLPKDLPWPDREVQVTVPLGHVYLVVPGLGLTAENVNRDYVRNLIRDLWQKSFVLDINHLDGWADGVTLPLWKKRRFSKNFLSLSAPVEEPGSKPLNATPTPHEP